MPLRASSHASDSTHCHPSSIEERAPEPFLTDFSRRCEVCHGHCRGTEMHSLTRVHGTETLDGSSAGGGIESINSDSLQASVLKGDVVVTACDATTLIAAYVEARGTNTADSPADDLAAMRHNGLHGSVMDIRRSERIQNLPQTIEPTPALNEKKRKRKEGSDEPTSRSTKQKIPPLERLPRTKNELKWVAKDGTLAPSTQTWILHDAESAPITATSTARPGNTPSLISTLAPPATPSENSAPSFPFSDNNTPYPASSSTQRVSGLTASSIKSADVKKRQHRGGYGQRGNYGRDETMQERTYARGDTASSPSFSIIHDASVASTGWQGRKPPPIARARIDHLYRLEPDAAALYPYIRYFFPVPFKLGTSDTPERGTFFLDKNGIVFAYRSWRALWLAELVQELEDAQAILVGSDLDSKAIRAACATSPRGPHLPIILGHQRQSSVKPYLTAWHRKNAKRVALFMEQPVVKAIIRWVANVFRTIWPGLAARFEEDAAYHLTEHGIKPLFGYFWNFCWNASFPGQARIHTGPHADCKNQVGVCMILVYVLKHGVNFNHKFRSWIVLWEAELAIEMPPWVLTGYPSALFYHFNIDIHRFQFVYTLPHVHQPTPENSWPIVEGDEVGRGSMVFFSQSTMRHGPATGFDTLEQAVEAGHSGTTEFGDDIHEAFQKAAVRTKVTEADLANKKEN